MGKHGIIVMLLMALMAVPCRGETPPKEDGRDMGQGLKKIGKDTGKAFKEGGREVSQGFKKIGKETGPAVKEGGKESVQTARKAVRSQGHGTFHHAFFQRQLTRHEIAPIHLTIKKATLRGAPSL